MQSVQQKTSQWSDPAIKKNYKLLEELGKGSFGTVIKAKNRETGQKVAIKMIKDIDKSTYSLRKLLREIIILRKLSEIENNIFTIKLLDIIIPQAAVGDPQDNLGNQTMIRPSKGESACGSSVNFDTIFLVMDFGESDFKKMLNSVPDTTITEEHVKILLYNQLCSLKFLHSANLVHRDIKPANLLLDDQCRVLVCDFGLARSLPEKDELDRSLRKLHSKAYEKVQKAPAEERKSRHEEFKASVSEYLVKHRKQFDKKPRGMTCQVMSRWYRAPEVILTCSNYGQAVDIFAMGLILVEMIYCSEVYHNDEEFSSHKRYLFPGQSCYPISSNGSDTVSKDDQIIKLIQRLQLDPKFDFSFLTNKDEDDYCQEAVALAQKHNDKQKLSEVFKRSDPMLLQIAEEMLQFNPSLRPTADQLLRLSYFDDIRMPQNEVKAPHKIHVNIDKNELQFDYEQEKVNLPEETVIQNFKKLILKESQKLKVPKNS